MSDDWLNVAPSNETKPLTQEEQHADELPFDATCDEDRLE